MTRARRRLALGTAAVLAGVIVVGGCGGWVSGSGDLVTREVDVRGVTRVEVGSSFAVTVTYGQSAAATITIDDNLVEFLEAEVSGDTLRVGMESLNTYTDETLRLQVTIPRLSELKLSGASKGRVHGFTGDAPLRVEASGASRLELTDLQAGATGIEASGASRVELKDVRTGAIDVRASGASRVSGRFEASGTSFDLSGASKAEVAGSGGDLRIDASGASGLELARLVCDDGVVGLSGASRATVNVAGTLDVDLSGASGLKYVGRPQMGALEVTGASSIDRVE